MDEILVGKIWMGCIVACMIIFWALAMILHVKGKANREAAERENAAAQIKS